MCKFRSVISAINFATVLRNTGEGQNAVQIHSGHGEDVFGEQFHVLRLRYNNGVLSEVVEVTGVTPGKRNGD